MQVCYIATNMGRMEKAFDSFVDPKYWDRERILEQGEIVNMLTDNIAKVDMFLPDIFSRGRSNKEGERD